MKWSNRDYFMIIFFLLMTSLLFESQNIQGTQINSRDYWPTEGWLISTLEEENMDPTYLVKMLQYMDDEGYTLDSILLIRNGYLVYEEYFKGWNDSVIHPVFSVTKSVISCLIGIAKEEGLLQLNQTVLSYFPGRIIENLENN